MMGAADAPARVLAHERIGGPERAAEAAWFLHGIYGAGRNWRSVATRTLERRPCWSAVLVDLRMHGDSRGFPPPHDLTACAGDLAVLARQLEEPPTAVIGHSFGGKVALVLAGRAPAGLRQLWVIDASPSARPLAGSALDVLGALRDVPEEFARREEALRALQARSVSKDVARWLVTNLEGSDGGFRWRLELDALEALLVDFLESDLWHLVAEPPSGCEIRFVKATESDALPESDWRRLEALARDGVPLRLHLVEGGHWLNADAPEALVSLLTRALPECAPSAR